MFPTMAYSVPLIVVGVVLITAGILVTREKATSRSWGIDFGFLQNVPSLAKVLYLVGLGLFTCGVVLLVYNLRKPM